MPQGLERQVTVCLKAQRKAFRDKAFWTGEMTINLDQSGMRKVERNFRSVNEPNHRLPLHFID